MNSNRNNVIPVHWLPSGIRETVLESEANMKAPSALIVGSALGVLSLACQGLIDVRLPIGQVRPVSLFLITIASSGERKSSCDQLFTKPIRDFETAANIQTEALLAQFEVDSMTWELKFKALTAKILKLEAKEASNAL